MLGIIVAPALLGSLVFAAPSSNATILFVIVGGILFVGRHLDQVALTLHGAGAHAWFIRCISPSRTWNCSTCAISSSTTGR